MGHGCAMPIDATCSAGASLAVSPGENGPPSCAATEAISKHPHINAFIETNSLRVPRGFTAITTTSGHYPQLEGSDITRLRSMRLLTTIDKRGETNPTILLRRIDTKE